MPKKIELSDIPKVTPIDRTILILEETISDLKLRLSELRALQTPYRGRFEMARNPLTGEVSDGKRKTKPKKREPETV